MGSAVNQLPASDGRIRLECSRCRQVLAFAWIDEEGAISYRSIQPVSWRFRVPFTLTEVDEGGATTTRSVHLEDLGLGQVSGPIAQDKIRFREHRRCRATPTVTEAWLDQQVGAAIAAGRSSVSISSDPQS